MARIVWSEPALDDLDKIAEYIALDNLEAAKRLVQTVFAKVDRLKDFPSSSRKVPELRNSRYREVIVGPCRIFCRAAGSSVLVLHVMRSERELRNMLILERDREDTTCS